MLTQYTVQWYYVTNIVTDQNQRSLQLQIEQTLRCDHGTILTEDLEQSSEMSWCAGVLQHYTTTNLSK